MRINSRSLLGNGSLSYPVEIGKSISTDKRISEYVPTRIDQVIRTISGESAIRRMVRACAMQISTSWRVRRRWWPGRASRPLWVVSRASRGVEPCAFTPSCATSLPPTR